MRIQNSLLKGIFPAIILCVVLAACNKDKFTTKPQLEFKRVNSHNVSVGDIFTFTLGFTDKEGDLTDSLWVESIVASCPASNLTARYKIPNFPSKANEEGEFSISFSHGSFIQDYVPWPSLQCQRPDTTVFRFWMRDKAGNVSDTVYADKPIIFKN